jgi:hypothetical protein
MQMCDFADAVRAVLVAMAAPEAYETAAQARSRLEALAPEFDGRSPVVDVRSGAGGMLDLLRERETEAIGIELDPLLVSRAQVRGHDVRLGRGVDYLEAVPDQSLGGIFADSVGRLSVPRLEELLTIAARKLHEDGRLVMASGRRPLERGHGGGVLSAVAGDELATMVRSAGFAQVRITELAVSSGSEGMEPIPEDGLPSGAVAAINRNFEKLNRALFPPAEFAVIARR